MKLFTVEKLETIMNILLKGIIILIIILLSITLLPPLVSQIKFQLESGALVEKFGIAGAMVELSNKINTPERLYGNEDSTPSKAISYAAGYLISQPDTQTYIEETWFYVGEYQDGAWLTSYFDVTNIPKSGDILIAKGEINRRSDKPRLIDGQWKMGEIEGTIKKGDKIQVREIDKVKSRGGYLIVWIRGSIVE